MDEKIKDQVRQLQASIKEVEGLLFRREELAKVIVDKENRLKTYTQSTRNGVDLINDAYLALGKILKNISLDNIL